MMSDDISALESDFFAAILQHLSSESSPYGVDAPSDNLHALVEAIRQHLGMEVAFISRFRNGCREFTHLSLHPECSAMIAVGHQDPSESTYCQKICNHELPSIIPDTKKHPVTRRMAVTEALNIGSYIGVPIKFSDNRIYGTLCCFSSKPDDSLSHKDLSILTLFARFAARNIESEVVQLEQQENMRNAISKVLEDNALNIVLQPIYDCYGSNIIGFECLSRFESTPYHPPNVWFARAHEAGVGELLELYAIELALELLALVPQECFLTVNISPACIYSKALAELLERHDLQRIVLEVTEREIIDDYQLFRETLAPLRAQGMRLAVDDAGAGFASFQHILELQADIIKLDRSLISNVDQDRSRRALIAALMGFAKEMDTVVLGEGVETIEEVQVLHKLGVNYVQGYYFSYPMNANEAINLYQT